MSERRDLKKEGYSPFTGGTLWWTTAVTISQYTHTILVRARAPTVGGRIEIVRILLLLILCQMNWLFEGFIMLKSSPKFAGNSKVGEIYVFWSSLKWAWQNGSTAPPIHSPWVHFDRYICQYWLIITALPAGDRKWHVLYFDELLLAALQYAAQMSSVKSWDHGLNCSRQGSTSRDGLWYILLIDLFNMAINQNDMFGAVGPWLSDSLQTPPSVSARSPPKKERSMCSLPDSVETHMWKCYLLSSLGEKQPPYIKVGSTLPRQTSDSTENVSGQFLQGARHDPLLLCNKPYYANKNGVRGDSFIIIIYNITAA